MKAVKLQTLQEVMKTRGREIRKEPEEADAILDEMAGLTVQKELRQDMETARAIERIHDERRIVAPAAKNASRKMSRSDDNQKFAKFLYALYPPEHEMAGKVIPLGEKVVVYRGGRTQILRSRYV